MSAIMDGIDYGAVAESLINEIEDLETTAAPLRAVYGSFGTKLWWDQGVPSSVIGLQLGHKDGRSVERVYGQGRTTLQQLEHWAGVVAGETKEPKREAK